MGSIKKPFICPFKKLRYFKKKEFDSPDVLNSGILMDHNFLKKLDQARSIAGMPFIISSGFRTVMHNKSVGGVANSSHIKGLAADVKYRNSNELMLIVKSLILAGFTRIKIYKNHVHVDLDTDKIQNWLGVSGNFH